MTTMIELRTGPHGEQYRLITALFDSLRNRTWVLVEVDGKQRPKILTVPQWRALADTTVKTEVADGVD